MELVISLRKHYFVGNYSRLKVEFEFKRLTYHYVKQIYVPCNMLVILSWISFWLNRRAANVRLALCVLTVVIMTISLQILETEWPKTSYTKAIDVYTGVCMTFLFFALVGKLNISKKKKTFRILNESQ